MCSETPTRRFQAGSRRLLDPSTREKKDTLLKAEASHSIISGEAAMVAVEEDMVVEEEETSREITTMKIWAMIVTIVDLKLVAAITRAMVEVEPTIIMTLDMNKGSSWEKEGNIQVVKCASGMLREMWFQ